MLLEAPDPPGRAHRAHARDGRSASVTDACLIDPGSDHLDHLEAGSLLKKVRRLLLNFPVQGSVHEIEVIREVLGLLTQAKALVDKQCVARPVPRLGRDDRADSDLPTSGRRQPGEERRA